MNDTERSQVAAKMLSELGFSTRVCNCLSGIEIVTLGDLLGKTPDDLMDARNFGVTMLNEVRTKLALLGVSLLDDKPSPDVDRWRKPDMDRWRKGEKSEALDEVARADQTQPCHSSLSMEKSKAMNEVARAYAVFLAAKLDLRQAETKYARLSEGWCDEY